MKKGPMQVNMKSKTVRAAFLIGSLVALAEVLFFAFYPHFPTMDTLWLLLVCLNPPLYLGGVFVDIDPTNAQLLILCTVVVLLNALFYASAAALFLQLRGWLRDPARSIGRA
jgi:hypothetical protein